MEKEFKKKKKKERIGIGIELKKLNKVVTG